MRTPTPQAFLVILAALGGAAVTALFGFGPLDPPNGPIAPTYKTLSEVEPRIALSADNTPGDADSVFKIGAQGSYYLTGPLTVPSGKGGIKITTSNVTVDLNGFRVAGLAGSLDGIHVNTALAAITIRDGVIIQARGDGIDAADGTEIRIEGVTVKGCTGQGIVVGDYDEVANCTVMNNGSHGINTGDACRVTDCIAGSNGGVGIDVDNDSTVRDCVATGNTNDGISTNDGCTVAGCTASINTANGINTEGTCVVSDSVGRANGGIGIDVDATAIVRDCAARDNTGSGISANDGSVITACTAAVNQNGITAGDQAAVSGCNTYLNRAHGLAFGSYSFIYSNCTVDNGTGGDGSGLYTAGDRSRVDENQIKINEVGIQTDGKDNDIARNFNRWNHFDYINIENDVVTWPNIAPWSNW